MSDFIYYIRKYYMVSSHLSEEAMVIISNICRYAADYEDGDGRLTEDGINFIDDMLSDVIGLNRDEIAENWGYTV